MLNVGLTALALMAAQQTATTTPEPTQSPDTETATQVSDAPVALPAPPTPSGKIIMYRPSAIMGMGLACPIRYKGVELVELGRGKFAEWDVPPGSYILSNKTASVEVNVMPGQTKHVRCQIKPGFMTGRADLQIVDRESYAEHQSEYERKDVVQPVQIGE